jgi:hypothetical protein
MKLQKILLVKRIGDMYQQWDSNKERYEMYGEYPNQSNYVYVEMADDWKATIDDKIPYSLDQHSQKKIPWGFFGNITNGATITFTSFEGISYKRKWH